MGLKTNRFQKLFDRNQFYLEDLQKKSMKWYWKEVDALKAQRITPNKILRDNANKHVNQIVPGNLYFYEYDPKTKATLPYYDVNPMVFPFAYSKGGFTGINMHYLPYRMRIILLGELMEYKTSKHLSERTKIKMSWGMLQGLSSHKLVEPCVKRYLYSHVRSNIIQIKSYHYATALMMPVSRFKKRTEQGVWFDSVYGK